MSTSKHKRGKRPNNDDEQHPSSTKKRVRINDHTRDSSEATLQRDIPEDARQHALGLWKHVLNDVYQRVSNKYVYMPLKERYGQDIRVLIIEPGARDEPIFCRLVPSALNDAHAKRGTKAIQYIALSYFWGDGEPIHNITLTSYEKPSQILQELSIEERVSVGFSKGKTWNPTSWTPTGNIQVRSNLYRALQRFRSRTKQVTMWIDALCIDQEDENERSAQVKKMHELYLNSKRVCVWLGTGENDEPNPQHCFQFLKKLLHLKDLESALGQCSEGELSLADNADNITRLMCNKWFSRRWVLQELALGRKAEVVYGSEKMQWSDFSDAIAIFIKSFDRIRSIWKEGLHPSAAEKLATTDIVRNFGANVLVEFTNNLFRRSERGEIQQRMMTLEGLVSSLLAFEATDPRDTIYAVLSLAKDTYQLSIDSVENENAAYPKFDQRLTPNYRHKGLIHVYTEFIDYCIEKSGSLDILFRHWAPSMERTRTSFSQSNVPTVEEYWKESLPSWIPRLQNSSHGTPDQRNRGRSNGDSFVGAISRSGQRNYSASLDMSPIYEFGEGELAKDSRVDKNYNGRLSIKGLHIGTIHRVARRAAHGVIFRDAFDIAGFERERWNSRQEWARRVPRVPEEFWRTLVGDRGPDGTNPPSWYARACLDCLKNLPQDGILQPEAIIASESTSTITKDFLERVKNVIWQRRLGRVHLRGPKVSEYVLGLFPAETQEDDIVCIFFGCSVPVILRPSGQGQEDYYTMVGECFVYGMMEGEAVSGISPKDDGQFFELV